MVWRTATFLNALRGFLSEFDKQPRAQTLALVWRAPDEYSVMDFWLLEKIFNVLDPKRLRVVLWLDRGEAAEMISALNGGG